MSINHTDYGVCGVEMVCVCCRVKKLKREDGESRERIKTGDCASSG